MDAPCMNKRPHLFLTGEKGIGKSTLLQKLLVGRRACGFRTVKAVEVYLGRTSRIYCGWIGRKDPRKKIFSVSVLPFPAGRPRKPLTAWAAKHWHQRRPGRSW